MKKRRAKRAWPKAEKVRELDAEDLLSVPVGVRGSIGRAPSIEDYDRRDLASIFPMEDSRRFRRSKVR